MSVNQVSLQVKTSEKEKQTFNDLTLLRNELRSWISSGLCQGENGAFHAWRDYLTGELAFEYPEITGYVLTYFSNLDELTNEEEKSAKRAAEWIAQRINSGNLHGRPGDEYRTVYNFDLAMIATGLLAYGTRFNEEYYISTGLNIVTRFIEDIKRNSHLAAIQPSDKVFESDQWSTMGHAHMFKAVQCLLMADRLGVNTQEYAEQLYRYTLQFINPDGSIQTHKNNHITYLHPHLYTIEGLWMWGTAKGDLHAIEMAKKSLEWAINKQLPSGGFPRYINRNGETELREQSDVTSQLIRLAALLDVDFPGYTKALERLSQIAHGDGFGKAIIYSPETGDIHQNSWCSFFASQAIDIVLSKNKAIEWSKFI